MLGMDEWLEPNIDPNSRLTKPQCEKALHCEEHKIEQNERRLRSISIQCRYHVLLPPAGYPHHHRFRSRIPQQWLLSTAMCVPHVCHASGNRSISKLSSTRLWKHLSARRLSFSQLAKVESAYLSTERGCITNVDLVNAYFTLPRHSPQAIKSHQGVNGCLSWSAEGKSIHRHSPRLLATDSNSW